MTRQLPAVTSVARWWKQFASGGSDGSAAQREGTDVTNLGQLKRSRRKQQRGDVFAMLLPDDRYRFGRVISTSAVVGPLKGVLLLYVYRYRARDMGVPDREELRPDRLLVSPILTNSKGWREGVFETVGHVPLDECDVLEQHCFRRWNGEYFDEKSNPLPGPVEPVGDFGLHSFRTIDDEISDALGFARA